MAFDLIQVAVAALANGSLYALIMIGVLLVWQVSRRMNFAYGQIGMFGAFCVYIAWQAGVPWPLALVAGIVLTIALSALVEYALIRRIPERGGYDVVVTLGLFVLLTALVQTIVDANAHIFLPLGTDRPVVTGRLFVNLNDVLCIILGLVVVVIAWWVLQRTSLGTSLRAAAAHPSIAASAGIDVARLRAGVWAASAVLIAIAAFLFASRLSLNAFYLQTIVINVFIAGMIGGLNRFWAPILCAYGIALFQGWTAYALGDIWVMPALFALVIGVFSLVPRRFLEERHEDRA